MLITSRANPRLRELAKLKRAGHRSRAGVALAEGEHLVREALRPGVDTRAILVTPEAREREAIAALLEVAAGRDIEVLELTPACYAKVSDLRSPEGVAAVIAPGRVDPAGLLVPDARLLILAGLQDPGNAGAAVRAAAAAGASGCVLLDGVDPTGPKFLRAAMGSSLRLPCARAHAGEFLPACRAAGVRLLGAVSAGERGALEFERADYTPPVGLCIGGEGAGLPAAVLAACARRIHVPMAAGVESLNAAVAAGIILYRARASWRVAAAGIGKGGGAP